MVEQITLRSKEIASNLLSIGAVTLSPHQPYTWASGLKSPIYCDNRLTISYPQIRNAIADGFAEGLAHLGVEVDVIVGTATAGIPHAAFVAQKMNKPMAYVRSKPKAHGRGNQIEGIVEAGQRVVVIEDLISTGKSSLAVVNVLREAGAVVMALEAIFSYGLSRAVQKFQMEQLQVHPLTSLDTLLEVAVEENAIQAADLTILADWKEDPEGWSAARS